MDKIIKFQYTEGEDFVRGRVQKPSTDEQIDFVVGVVSKRMNPVNTGNIIEFWVDPEQLIDRLNKLDNN
jgi:hypothetical protein